MQTFTRAIAVRFLPTTNTKGSRLKASMVGCKARTYGFHSFDGCTVAEEQAARDYFARQYNAATIRSFVKVANPCNGDALFIVKYEGAV